MKNLIILILAMFAWSNANAQWTLLNPAPTSNDLYSVYFPDVNTGYVVGERGTILKTTDGGTLWTQLNSGTVKNLNSVSFTDLNTGYIVGDSGCILKTINGGSTWTLQSSGTSFSLRSVHFPVDGIGYAVGDSMMLSTKNGGVTWTGKSLADGLLDFRLNFVYFVNADTGFATASQGWVYRGMVYKTTNGGLDWTICFIQGSGEMSYLGSMSFTDANTG